jgi:hypothetical protein
MTVWYAVSCRGVSCCSGLCSIGNDASGLPSARGCNSSCSKSGLRNGNQCGGGGGGDHDGGLVIGRPGTLLAKAAPKPDGDAKETSVETCFVLSSWTLPSSYTCTSARTCPSAEQESTQQRRQLLRTHKVLQRGSHPCHFSPIFPDAAPAGTTHL